jgi:hypothetical protein
VDAATATQQLASAGYNAHTVKRLFEEARKQFDVEACGMRVL